MSHEHQIPLEHITYTFIIFPRTNKPWKF